MPFSDKADGNFTKKENKNKNPTNPPLKIAAEGCKQGEKKPTQIKECSAEKIEAQKSNFLSINSSVAIGGAGLCCYSWVPPGPRAALASLPASTGKNVAPSLSNLPPNQAVLEPLQFFS